MANISFHTLIWLTYKLGATFAFGLPLTLLIWATIKQERSIVRLLSIYWKVASLIPISILLLTGDRPIGYLTSFISPLLLIFAVWFWVDLNEELADLPLFKPLPFMVKAWRWMISFFGIFYAILISTSLSCMQSMNGEYCNTWKEAPRNFHQMAQVIFNFLFGANWTESLAAFIGYLALVAYFVGFLQWLLMRLPKQGRFAGDF